MKTSKYFFRILFFFLLIIVSGCKKDPPKTLPGVTTTEISNITSISAKSGGTITDDGNSHVLSRGVCWSTFENPTIANSKTTDGTGIGTFTSSIIDLTPGETYYVRAYATNSVGTAFGNQVSFNASITTPTISTTEVIAITSTTATSGGNITSDGGAGVIARGVCWSTSQNPTTANSKTTNGMGTGSFVSSITALTPGTTYYLRAYATNSVGTAYGTQITFNTSANVPTVTTTAITEITPESAISGGNVTNDGGAAVTARGVCWSTSQNPTIDNTKTVNGSGIGEFTAKMTGLIANTTYYVRAYAINIVGVGYGEILQFNTSFDPSQYFGLIPTPSGIMGNIPTLESSTIDSLSSFFQINVKSTSFNKSVILDFPIPGSQQLGDCSAWSVGYALMSYVFKNVFGNVEYNKNTLQSPLYIFYNRSNKKSKGIYLYEAFQVAKDKGCCTITVLDTINPPETYITTSLENQDASNHKLSSYYKLGKNIELIKKCIAYGNPVAVGILVDNAFVFKYKNTIDALKSASDYIYY